jgi:hypothetical protein
MSATAIALFKRPDRSDPAHQLCAAVSEGELNVRALTEGTKVSQPRGLQAFGGLKLAGLVHDRRDGPDTAGLVPPVD